MSIKTKVKAVLFNPKGVYSKYVTNKRIDLKSTTIEKKIKHNSTVKHKAVDKSKEHPIVNNGIDSICPIDLISNIEKGDFVYIPWILTHGDKMISALAKSTDIKLKPLWLNEGVHNDNVRISINAYARNHPEEFRRYILAHLSLFREDISAIILTLD